MMRTVPQIHIEMDPYSATAAEEDGGAVRGKPGPVRGEKQIGLELVTQLLANLAQIRRPDLLAGFNDKFGVEAEPAAARLANGAKRRQIDTVLPLIVGGTTAVDAIVDGRRPPRIQIIPPFPPPPVNHITLPVHEDVRNLG